jgi:Dual OB-containing domain
MATVKRLVCLANSRKLSGRCVAGKELIDNRPAGWIRPVSAREHEEVSEYERQYEDGSDPRLLDIMEVPLLVPRPKGCQRENWLLDPDYYWCKAGRVTWNDLQRLVDPVAPLWTNGYSTYNGCNDRIPLAVAQSVDSSLRLVRAERLKLSVFKPGEAFGNPKRRVQAQFHYGGTEYALWVTDPDYERAYLAKADGDHEIGESFLTISLGEPHNDNCYKLVAAIIERGRGSAP